MFGQRYWKRLHKDNENRRGDWCGWRYLEAHRCVCGQVECTLQGACHCGCSQIAEIAKVTQHGTFPPYSISGLPSKYIKGHDSRVGKRKGRKNRAVLREVESMRKADVCLCGEVACSFNGLCHCGCGGVPHKAKATRVDTAGVRTAIGGSPVLYIKGHTPQHQKGRDSLGFVGDRTFQPSRGYWLIYMPEHPRAVKGRVLEHIYLAEKRLGRPLLYYGFNNGNNEVVHHRNLDSTDNRLSNLVVMSARDHVALHRRIELERK